MDLRIRLIWVTAAALLASPAVAEETTPILDGVSESPQPALPTPIPETEEALLSACDQALARDGSRPDEPGGARSLAPQQSAAGRLAGLPLVGIAVAATGIAGVGTGVMGARWIHRHRSSAAPATDLEADEEDASIDRLAKNVEARPLDPLANYRLAVALHVEGSVEDSVRHLDRALRLEPSLIVHFLNDPAASDLRRREDVHRMLREHQRELNRKLWSGYA